MNFHLGFKKWTLGLALVAATPLARAADTKAPTALINGQIAGEEEMLHQQNFGPGSDVQAKPGSLDPHKSFLENIAPPKNFTSFAGKIDWLFQYTSWVTFAFFVAMAAALVFFIFAYRERPGHKAFYTHGVDKASSNFTHFLDILVFVSLDLVLLVNSFKDTANFLWKYPTGPDVVKVMVMPQQWAWNFRYAGKDGIFNTADDIVTINEMKIPENKPVLIQIKSKDVIHGFFVPNARIQIDAIPGQVSRLWFDANTVGHYEIACYHLCGTAHYKMKAFLQVMKENDYKRWSDEMSSWNSAKFDPTDKAVQWGWDWGI